MLSKNDAIRILRRKYPQRRPTQFIDYDNDWFLIAAVEGNSMDFDSPYFAINKQSGVIKTYSPIDDLEKFTDAIQNRAVNLL